MIRIDRKIVFIQMTKLKSELFDVGLVWTMMNMWRLLVINAVVEGPTPNGVSFNL